MAFVVAVAQQKGGAGKSTVAANLAAALAAVPRRVALLDTDPQRTLGHWHEARVQQGARAAPLDFSAPSGWRVPAIIDGLKRNHDIIVIDTAPHAETEAKVAIRAADLVLMPLQPSPADLWASAATLKLAAAEGRYIAALLNRVPAAGKLRDSVIAELRERGVPLLGPMLGNRVQFAQSFGEGLAVTESAPKSVAAEEMRAVAEAILALAGDKG